jgi:tetratricopeptide (TPR) repeat protein
VLFIGVAAIGVDAQHEHAAATGKLGRVHFPISCAPETQMPFDRALAMLHSFWYQEGLNAFTEVTKRYPACAMAYWGIAVLARGNPLVSAPDAAGFKRGKDAIQKAKTLGATTDRERDFINSMAIYYQDGKNVDHRARVLAYEQAMEHIYRKYPEDPEAAIFYALALNEAITVLPADKTYTRPTKAVEILEKVLATHPDHPGALHYFIHSCDFPPLASRGLAAAKRYAGIAPSAAHALHMPSHIFSMLGMWPESIQSNQAALAASNTYVHALDFMQYAYLQRAQDDEAKRLVRESEMLQKAQTPAISQSPTGGVLGVYTAYAAIPARYALERGQWAEACSLEAHPTFPAADAITHFARAIGCARVGNLAGAQKDIHQLQLLGRRVSQSKDAYWAEQIEIQKTGADAWLAHAEGKKDVALRLMRAAADREDQSEKHVAMENRLWPMRELLAELLLSLNEPAKALDEFEVSFAVSPNRFRGLYGAAKAAERSGDVNKARMYHEKLVAMCSQADSSRPELLEAKSFLAKN